MTAALPLAGRRIVVTRPRDQALGLKRRIEQLGGIPLLFPLLQIEPVQVDAELRAQLAHLPQTDFAIFISPNAVRYGMAAIEAGGGVPPTLKIAAVGQGTARALRELGVGHVIVPTERFDSEGLLELAELQQGAGLRVMILRGDGGRELLGDTLKARGASVEYVSCYLRSKAPLDGAALLAAHPDVLTVTSSEALGYLNEQLNDAAKAAIAALPLFVPHERIAAAARRQGWGQVNITGSGDDGLLSGLIAWSNAKRN